MRERLKYRTPQPHTETISIIIQQLNREITEKIRVRKESNWKNFANTLDHRTNSKKLFKTIKSLTLSNNSESTTHAAITKDDNIPSRKQQANILIDHYAKCSRVPYTRDSATFSIVVDQYICLLF